MGSIEVFDFKQKKWVPYVPDYDKWKQHFHDIQEGYAKPDHMGRYLVGSGKHLRSKKENTNASQQPPQVKFVTPIAQALEIAKSELRREQSTDQRKNEAPRAGKKKKNNKQKAVAAVIKKRKEHVQTITQRPKYPKTVFEESQLNG